MSKYIVLLKDGTEIAVDEASIAPSFVVNTATKEDAMEIWNKLTIRLSTLSSLILDMVLAYNSS